MKMEKAITNASMDSAITDMTEATEVEYEEGEPAPGACTGEKFLLSVIRRQPAVCQKLGVTPEYQDKEILEVLKTKKDVGQILSSYGVDPKLIGTATAYGSKAADDEADRRWRMAMAKCRNGGSTKALGQCIVPIGVLLIGIGALLYFTAASGWLFGKCQIARYYNDTCHQGNGCSFNINIQEIGNVRGVYEMKDWDPPATMIPETGHVYYLGEPFRCCNNINGAIGVGAPCCDFYKPDADTYCDNWFDQSDSDGNLCPSEAWSCIFKTAVGAFGDDEAVEVQFYTPPEVMEWLYYGGVSVVLGICCIIDFLPFKILLRQQLRLLEKAIGAAERSQVTYLRVAEKYGVGRPGQPVTWRQVLKVAKELTRELALGCIAGIREKAAKRRQAAAGRTVEPGDRSRSHSKGSRGESEESRSASKASRESRSKSKTSEPSSRPVTPVDASPGARSPTSPGFRAGSPTAGGRSPPGSPGAGSPVASPSGPGRRAKARGIAVDTQAGSEAAKKRSLFGGMFGSSKSKSQIAPGDPTSPKGSVSSGWSSDEEQQQAPVETECMKDWKRSFKQQQQRGEPEAFFATEERRLASLSRIVHGEESRLHQLASEQLKPILDPAGAPPRRSPKKKSASQLPPAASVPGWGASSASGLRDTAVGRTASGELARVPFASPAGSGGRDPRRSKAAGQSLRSSPTRSPPARSTSSMSPQASPPPRRGRGGR